MSRGIVTMQQCKFHVICLSLPEENMHKDIVKDQVLMYFHSCINYFQHMTLNLKMVAYLTVDMYLVHVINASFCIRSLCLLLDKYSSKSLNDEC